MNAEIPPSAVANLLFRGRHFGMVKQLGGFKKSHHTVPDAANPVTNAFLGKIAAGELAEEAERMFQNVRVGLEYKRSEVQLQLTPPAAVLTAKDFSVEIAYALSEESPAQYVAVLTLSGLRRETLARSPEFQKIFARRFTELVFALRSGVQVEAVIDAIEALRAPSQLSVNYPSDYRNCEIAAEGVAAKVTCTAEEMVLAFPTPGSPAELLDAFAAVRSAFQISPVLRKVVGR